ncbi:MAG TPA: hydrogenase maturation nickel metallochaperone HypA [Bryobacteraceae bacterium]|jgi:hydrogenase nickel incorporation protein HypA/HybF|nr:hydrogenase maturation nickel metallochaperone HypA [Bryobacteraceae bacterium]
MHELSIAISLIEAAQEEAEKHHAAGVTAVHLRLGALAGVERDALLFSYGLASEGTPLEGSQLIVEEMPVMVFCASCRERRPIRSLQSFCCAVCDTPATEIVQGRELEIVALDIDQEINQ